MLKHAENTMAANHKTLGFSAFSEFSVGTTIERQAQIALAAIGNSQVLPFDLS
jgi:hypothetical protein